MPVRLGLSPLDLPVLELNWRRTAENCCRYPQLTSLRVDFFDYAVLILERPVCDLHRLANLKADFGLHLLLTLFHLREHRLDLRLPHWDRFIFRSGKADYAGRFANEIPSPADELIVLVEQMHVYDQVARKKFPRSLALFALLNFRDAFGRDEHFVNQVAHLFGFHALIDVLFDLVLLAGENM